MMGGKWVGWVPSLSSLVPTYPINIEPGFVNVLFLVEHFGALPTRNSFVAILYNVLPPREIQCALSSCQAVWGPPATLSLPLLTKIVHLEDQLLLVKHFGARPQSFQFLSTQCTSFPICIVRPRYVLACSLIYQCTRHVNTYKNVYDAYALCTFSLLLPSNVVPFIARSTFLLSTLKYMAHQLDQFYIFILNWIFVLTILYNFQKNS